MRLPRFLLQVTSNKGSNKGKISFCPVNSEQRQFLYVFARKLQFSSPREAIEIPSASIFFIFEFSLGYRDSLFK